MPVPDYSSSLRATLPIPNPTFRHQLAHAPHKRRSCSDGRPYVVVPFTIQGVLATGDFGPMWPSHRDYWVARITMVVGRHDTDTHPDDGTPSGSSVKANLRRWRMSDDSDHPLLVSDNRLAVDINHHNDVINDDEDGAASQGDFNIMRLRDGDHIYPRLTQVGSDRPGTTCVISLILVPVP